MKKRMVALALAVLFLLAACPLTAFAAQTAQVTAENSTAAQGGYAYVYLRADNFADVCVLDIEVYYDSSVMSVNYVSNGSLFSGASVSTNTATPGVIKISAMAVNGFGSDGRMMTLSFRVHADCPVGDYPVTVAVGDAYDTNMNPAPIKSVSGTVTVTKSAAQSFSVSASRSTSTAEQGDTVTLQVYNSSSRWFAGADFRLEYDRELLKLNAIELSGGLKVEGAVYSVNGDNPGYAVISYASTNAVNAYSLFQVSFEVIANVNTKATIRIAADDVYDDDLVAYAPYTTSTSIQITEKVMAPDHPDFTVATEDFVLGETGAATVTLQGGADVAAGDFTIHYDTTAFEVSAVSADQAAVDAGALIVINPNFGNGQIKFSYVNTQGSFPDDMALIHVTLTAVSAPSEHFVLSATGMGVYSVEYEETQLEYVSATACVFAPTVTPPTCTEEGYTTYACPDCGDSYVVDITDALGHDLEQHAAKAPTCTEVGWDAYESCSRCDYSTYVEIPMVEHVYDGECDPDCNVCGAIREVPVLPGDVNNDGRVNNRDLGIFQRYLNDWEVTVELKACDINNDGRINNRDLARLQQEINT